MRFISLVTGAIAKARQNVAQAASLGKAVGDDADQVTMDSAMKEMRQLAARLNRLEAQFPTEPLEFEVVVGIAGATVQLFHDFNGPVRWYVTQWQSVSGQPSPVKAPQLVKSSLSTAKNLVLASYVAGRAIIRVELSRYDIDPGTVLPGFATNGADTALISGHRLSVNSSTPVDPADSGVVGSTTLYMTPFMSGQLRLYYGGEWIVRTSPEVNIAVPATANTNYDVFAYWTGTAVALELLAWTSSGGGSSVRVALGSQDGVKVKGGDPTRLWLGTVRTGPTSGAIPDTKLTRFVWNQFNRVRRDMFFNAAGSWSYVAPSGLWRQVNLNTACAVQAVLGDVTHMNLHASVGCTVPAAAAFASGIGFNSISVNSAQTYGQWGMVAGYVAKGESDFSGYIVPGYHSINMLETGQTAGTYTFNGSGTPWASGLAGDFWA